MDTPLRHNSKNSEATNFTLIDATCRLWRAKKLKIDLRVR